MSDLAGPSDLIDNDTGGDVAVARALAEAVRVAGSDLATEPRRVQGMVNDVLGATARTRRAEIDAVVLAAEETIPEDLLTNRIDHSTALDRLQHRGLDTDLAQFAVDVWQYALGMLATDAQPPSLTNSLAVTTGPALTDATPDELLAPSNEPGESVVNDGSHTSTPPPYLPPTPSPAPTDEVHVDPAGTGRSRVWLIGAAAATVVAVVAAFALFSNGTADVDSADGKENSDEIAMIRTAETTFDTETTPLGDLTRTWTTDNGELTATLEFTNTTAAATTGRHYEVIPKTLAATADLITSEPAHTVIKNDPVIAWDLTIEPGATTTITYRIDVAKGTTDDDLDSWKTEQITETAAFTTERSTPPEIRLETPNGQLVGLPEVDIAGSTAPTSTVTINGQPATLDTNGRFILRIGGLTPGTNAITTTATNPYGTTNTVTINIVHDTSLVPVPNLIGLFGVDAFATPGFNMEIGSTTGCPGPRPSEGRNDPDNERVLSAKVTAQGPQPGVMVRPGTTVTIHISCEY